MSDAATNEPIPRQQVLAIRQARRYLRTGTGVLARLLNAYHEAEARGSAMGHLSDQ